MLASLPPRLPRIRIGRAALSAVVTVAVILTAVYFLTQSSEKGGESVSVRSGSGGGTGAAPRPGKQAPTFAVPLLTGGTFRLSDYQGQPVWINFWATWCPPCRAEMRDIQALQGRLQEDKVAFLALNFGEDPAEVARYVAAGGFTFPIGLDLDQTVADRYRMLALPTHIFIDRNGVVHSIRVGSLAPKDMVQILEKLKGAGGED